MVNDQSTNYFLQHAENEWACHSRNGRELGGIDIDNRCSCSMPLDVISTRSSSVALFVVDYSALQNGAIIGASLQRAVSNSFHTTRCRDPVVSLVLHYNAL